jgi:hypothetical protein
MVVVKAARCRVAAVLVVARRRVTAAVLDVRADMVMVEIVFWSGIGDFLLNDGVYFWMDGIACAGLQ